MPPAVLKLPPAYRAGPEPSSNAPSADTMGNRGSESEPVTPVPSADQLLPSHLAILLAVTPSTLLNDPAAYSAGPVPSSNTANANTPSVYRRPTIRAMSVQ